MMGQGINGLNILVVGGAGFIGSNLVRNLLNSGPRKIIIVDKELAFFRQENLEPRQVGKNIIDFNIGKIRINSDIQIYAVTYGDLCIHILQIVKWNSTN